jgi:hypothetical protein
VRFIKLAIISFVLLFGLVTAISLLIPSTVRISKAIDLRASKDSVRTLLTDTAHWRAWHPAYQNNRQQQASITITSVTDSLVTATISSPGKNSLLNGWQFYAHGNRESYTLQWYIDFKLRWYPWEKFGSLFYEATYGQMLEQGLSNIKKHVQPL